MPSDMTVSFMTEAGTEVPAVTADQMREVDRVAIEEVGPNLYQMMENAGRNLALSSIEMLGAEWRAKLVVVLAGTGGNGGGGICAARQLANRGAQVTVVVSDEVRLGGVPSEQLKVYRGTPGGIASVGELPALEPSLVIDAIVGYSLGGPPRGPVGDMIQWTAETPARILSLDVPSGVDATTGETPGVHVLADRTLTLALPKTGLAGPSVGELWLGDIGIPGEVYRRVGIAVSPQIFDSGFLVKLQS